VAAGDFSAPGVAFGDSFGAAGAETGGVVVPPPGGVVGAVSPPQAPRAAAMPITKVKRIKPLFINTP
jgi:hypothetical protein